MQFDRGRRHLEFAKQTPGVRKANTLLPDNISELEPPDPIPNSEVKRFSADGSVGSPHVRVGHCQASIRKAQCGNVLGFFLWGDPKTWVVV